MPRITQAQKERNRDEIVRAASEGFKRRGVDGVGIKDLMNTAGMTNGGFYNHFASKEDLVLEVYRKGFAESLAAVDAIRAEHADGAQSALDAVIDTYLTAAHRDHPEAGCPSAALPVDAGRHGAAPQGAYRDGLEGYFANLTELLVQRAQETGTELAPTDARQQAVTMFTQMIGAIVVSRAVAEADGPLADEVLTASRHQLERR
ncbi:TetR/AcrR family transcriptional regulator [Curtobacterium sp. MCBD17_023]|uniref:TetR/AcrR family transcriptional regulator n=1 Tax=Curtobacterium sp. MCBD17_023 TaxID=2175657 RepID=UPI000D8621CA|nr:TetR/AcrR family transcriptional regulator [Curtobacterium sp. MCBD17_023]PYY48103.1 TetR/AcrR family transcriptional regulator [Curtobacterium sp. MCBD17_023]